MAKRNFQYPIPQVGKESYAQYAHRIKELIHKGFKVHDLLKTDYDYYMKGIGGNTETIQQFYPVRINDLDLFVRKCTYQDGNTALEIVDKDDECYTIATVNVPYYPKRNDTVFIKDYSENEGVLNALIEAKIVEKMDLSITSDFVTLPLCKLLI